VGTILVTQNEAKAIIFRLQFDELTQIEKGLLKKLKRAVTPVKPPFPFRQLSFDFGDS
jgi:hypothetical protein